MKKEESEEKKICSYVDSIIGVCWLQKENSTYVIKVHKEGKGNCYEYTVNDYSLAKELYLTEISSNRGFSPNPLYPD